MCQHGKYPTGGVVQLAIRHRVVQVALVALHRIKTEIDYASAVHYSFTTATHSLQTVQIQMLNQTLYACNVVVASMLHWTLQLPHQTQIATLPILHISIAARRRR